MAEKTIFYKIWPSLRFVRVELERPDVSWEFVTIQPYFGTVWVAIKWLENGKYRLKIAGRMKELKACTDYEVLSFPLESMDDVMGPNYRERIKDFGRKKR